MAPANEAGDGCQDRLLEPHHTGASCIGVEAALPFAKVPQLPENWAFDVGSRRHEPGSGGYDPAE